MKQVSESYFTLDLFLFYSNLKERGKRKIRARYDEFTVSIEQPRIWEYIFKPLIHRHSYINQNVFKSICKLSGVRPNAATAIDGSVNPRFTPG